METCSDKSWESGDGGKVWSLGVWGENWSSVSSPGAHTLRGNKKQLSFHGRCTCTCTCKP